MAAGRSFCNTPSCDKMALMETEAIDVPDYAAYPQQVEHDCDVVISSIFMAYANHYRIEFSLFSGLLDIIREETPSGLISRGLVPRFQGMMNRVRIKGHPPHATTIAQFQSDGSVEGNHNQRIFRRVYQYGGLIIPVSIKNATSVSRLLWLADHFQSSPDPVKAWWVTIGGRLILLKNTPSERQNHYVSDFGNTAQVVAQVTENLTSFTNEDGSLEQVARAVNFWTDFYKNALVQKRDILKNHFILCLHQGQGGYANRNLFLLFALSLPLSMQQTVLEAGQFPTIAYSSYVGATDSLSGDQWLEPVLEATIAAIGNYDELERVYYSLIERVQHMVAQAKVRTHQMFHDNQNPFFTQIDIIFHSSDAQRLKNILLLGEIAKRLGQGCQEHLLRDPIHSFGERGEGESYRGFAEAVVSYFDSEPSYDAKQLAVLMRCCLTGEAVYDDIPYFLPNLVAAWFMSEAARNPLSILSGLMLLDIIERGITLVDKDNHDRYSWRHTLVHPSKPENSMDKVLIRDLYNDEVDLAHFDGSHPMAHGGSVNDSKTKLGKGQKLSVVQQKEGSLILHWLYVYLHQRHPELEIRPITAEESPLVYEKNKAPDYTRVTTAYNARDKERPTKAIQKNRALELKWRLLKEKILPGLKTRLATLNCLLEEHPIPTATKQNKTPKVPSDEEMVRRIDLRTEELLKTIRYYSSYAVHNKSGFFAGQLSRPMRDISYELEQAKPGKKTMLAALNRVISIATPMGQPHPIKTAACRLQGLLLHVEHNPESQHQTASSQR